MRTTGPSRCNRLEPVAKTNRLRAVLSFVLVAGAASFGWADEVRVYEGSIGPKLKIVVLSNFHGDSSDGRYSYVGKNVDVFLKGSRQDGWQYTGTTGGGRVTGFWTLALSPAGGFTGEWRNPEGRKPLPVRLDPIGQTEELYESRKGQPRGDPCKLDPQRNHLRLKRELEQHGSISCEVHLCGETPDGIVANTTRSLIGGRFVEEVTTSNGYCGGAYPQNHEIERYSYDLTTGREVVFADLFEDLEAHHDPILGSFKMDESELRALSQDQRALAQRCASLRDGSGRGFSVRADRQELVLYGNFPHVAAACNALPPVRARIEQLRPYLSETGKALLGLLDPASSSALPTTP